MKTFIHRLHSLDAADLAELRKSLGHRPGEYPRVYPIVERWLSPDALPATRVAHYLVAGLYAWKQRAQDQPGAKTDPDPEPDADGVAEKPRKQPGMGWSMAQLTESDGQVSTSTEKRFIHLLDSAGDELQQPLRQAVSLLKSRDVRVYWEPLLHDLMDWNRPDRRVQRRWARDFYNRYSQETTEGEQA